jgi:shikimate dehydrogenase
MSARISGATRVAAVAGSPVAHSLSPLIHNAWIAAAGLDAVYVALEPADFVAMARGFRGGVIRGLNVTAPFKEQALALADRASERARRAGAANLLLFETDGVISADNTDGEGLMAAFAQQAPGFDPATRPVVILGAGGAARGAASAFVDAGAPAVRIFARTPDRARALAKALGERVSVAEDLVAALEDAGALINATPAAPDIPPTCVRAVVMDMVYRPVVTPFLARARVQGLATVDGLAMLIGQAAPSFAALFGVAPPDLDIRAMVLAALSETA